MRGWLSALPWTGGGGKDREYALQLPHSGPFHSSLNEGIRADSLGAVTRALHFG